jgi:methionine-rich copper-binding protein CopC
MTPDLRFGRAAAALLAMVAVLLVPGVAAAHSELVSEVPATGTTVPSPFSGPIVLTFSEELASGSKADLVGPSGTTLVSATVDPKAMTMTFALTAPLDPGAYEVRWVSIADDGDLLRQPVVTFTVAPGPSSTAPSPEPSVAATPTASPIASTAPTPGPSDPGTPAGSGSDVIVPIIAALIVLGAGAAYLLSRRNRPADPT